MSFAISGISAVPVELSFSVFPHAGGVSQPSDASVGSSQRGAGFPETGTGKLSSANKVQVPAATSAHPAAAPTEASKSSSTVKDTVTLSTDAKVRDLRSQGEADTQIAATLNLPIKEVDSDLHVINNLTEILAAVTSGAISGGTSA